MITMDKSMTPFSANPFAFIFSALLIVAALVYFGWGILDRLGLAEEKASAVITGKHYNPPGVTYRTIISGGRTWSLSDPTSETYLVLLNVGQEPTVAIVSKDLHDISQPGDTVQVIFHRTRLSRRLEVIKVMR
jgi:hypothetical protein